MIAFYLRVAAVAALLGMGGAVQAGDVSGSANGKDVQPQPQPQTLAISDSDCFGRCTPRRNMVAAEPKPEETAAPEVVAQRD